MSKDSRRPPTRRPKSPKAGGKIAVSGAQTYKIGEAAEMVGVKAYVLRFWETEFPQLKPVKSSTGQRMYRHKDVESVLRIKKLLYEEGFTIAGARQHLRAEIKGDRKQSPLPFPARSTSELKHIRQGLREILTMLSARRSS